jgi:mannosylglycerate hydrolase
MTTDVHVISHTHWDREWYLTFEQYRARLIDLVDGVLDRMAADPSFIFHLDGQSVVLEDYLEVRPERERELRDRVAGARLLVGPWYVMPDMFLVSGEALVRNLALGLRIAEGFGRAMRVGYMPDPFGHIAQMPQILAGFGLEGAILWRGFGGREAEYWWEAPDGSRALLLHLPPEGYCNGLRLPLLSPEEMRRQAAAVVARERDRSHTGQVLLMVGVDHVEPHPALPHVIDALNELPKTAALLSTLPDYVSAVALSLPDGDAVATIRGELRGGEDYAHLLPGVLSARTYLKQANARVQRELEHWVEPVSVFARLSGQQVPSGPLRYAWRTLLQNHPHDSICGCSIDEVHEENVTRFARAFQAASTAGARAIRLIGGRIPPAPPGAIRCLVVNTDIGSWFGVAETTIEIPLGSAEIGREVDLVHLEEPLVFFSAQADVSGVTDHAGEPLAFQILHSEEVVSYRTSRYATPVALRVRKIRLAIALRDVPPMGYAVIDVHVSEEKLPGQAPTSGVRATDKTIESDLFKVEARGDGTLDILDKRSQARYHRAFVFEDDGDVGDEYNYSPPPINRRLSNADARRIRIRTPEAGPLTAALSIEMVLRTPSAGASDRRTRQSHEVDVNITLDIRVRDGSPIIECVARVNNVARDHRLRIMCPTAAADVTHHRADTAFGIVKRPVDRPVPSGPLTETPVASAPMLSFVDAGDDSAGAIVIADGLVEYEVVRTATGPAIALTLFRAVGDLSRDDLTTRQGHAGPGLVTPGAQCLGPHEYRFAFVPRAAPPSAGELYGLARTFLSPPRILSPCGGDGHLPASRSFLGVTGGAVLSAFKIADDGNRVSLRLFNPAANEDRISVTVPDGTTAVHLADLAERDLAACRVEDGRVSVALGPHRIQTMTFAVRPA